MRFQYRYVDDQETTNGVVESPDAAMAAVDVLGKNNRHSRHSICELALLKAQGAEVVEIQGKIKNSYSLKLIQVGSRKCVPLHIQA